MKLFRLLIVCAVVCGIAIFQYYGTTHAKVTHPGNNSAEQARLYAPDEVLVKFKDGTDPQSVLQMANIKPQRIERVYSIEAAAANFKKESKLEKDSNGWYSFLGKNYEEVGQIPDEEVFKEVYATLTDGEKSLYRTYVVKLPEDMSVEDTAAILSGNSDIEYAEPNYICKVNAFPQTLPNDTYIDPDQDEIWATGTWAQPYEDMWGLKITGANLSWSASQGAGVTVAVIDTGLDYMHSDIGPNIWINEREIPGNRTDDDHNGYIDDIYGWDFANKGSDIMDDNGHGSHVSGTIAACVNNNRGVAGVAPRARIMTLKGLDKDGYGLTSNLIKCVIYAASQRVKVINCSWGAQGVSQALTDAFHYANFRGSLCIAAAGNDNMDVSGYTPANIDTVMAVSASNQRDERCNFSNYGAKIDVAAPGGDSYYNDGSNFLGRNILSLRSGNDGFPTDTYEDGASIVGDKYYRARGTSMACPHVAGLAALIMAENPVLTNTQVRNIISTTADDVGTPGKDVYFGYGRINSYRACTTADIGARVYITSPKPASYIHATRIDITGSAYMPSGFQSYELSAIPLNNPAHPIRIKYPCPTQVHDGLLGSWDITGRPDGDYLIKLKVRTAKGLMEDYTKVVIDKINAPPAFERLTNKAAVIGQMLRFKVQAKDPDDPDTPQGRLAYSAAGLPPGAQFDTSTQTFTWQPNTNDKGSYAVTFTVKDSYYSTNRTVAIVTVVLERQRITENPYWQGNGCSYGNIVLWQDDRNSQLNSGSYYGDIYKYDLAAGKETSLTSSDGYSGYGFPALYNDKAIWFRVNMNNWQFLDLRIRDLNTGNERVINNSYLAYDDADIYDNKVVYTTYQNPISSIHMFETTYDLSWVRDTVITAGTAAKIGPCIYGNIIAWRDYKAGGDWGNIFMYNIFTKLETRITWGTSQKRDPAVYRDKIVWPDKPDGRHTMDIYVYNTMTGKKTAITDDKVSHNSVDIYDDKILYGGSIDNDDVYLYDLATGINIPIAAASSLAEYVDDINQNRIMTTEEEAPGTHYTDVYLTKFYIVPQILGIGSGHASPGQYMAISGNNLGYGIDGSRIEFANGVSATEIVTWKDNYIIYKVPANAISGPMKVVTKGGSSNGIYITIH